MSDNRTYRDRRDYLINAVQKRRKKSCHREVHSGLQLPREIVVEKSGEFREACPQLEAENGNPEPSPAHSKEGGEGAETRANARTLGIAQGKRPAPQLQLSERVKR